MNELQCEFEFSTPERKRLITELVDVRAADQGISRSELIEKALVERLVPKHPHAEFLTEMLFKSTSLMYGYQRAFEYYEGGINFEARALGGKPLVEEFHKLLLRNPTCTPIFGHVEELKILHLELDSIARYTSERSNHQSFILSDMVFQSKRNPERLMLANIVGQMLLWWTYLENKTGTYRVLTAMAGISAEWVRFTEEDVCAFLDTMEKVSEQWPNALL